jgi:hypothetical protein
MSTISDVQAHGERARRSRVAFRGLSSPLSAPSRPVTATLRHLGPVTVCAAVPVAAVAVIAGVVSFGHIEGLALAQHQPIADARLLPLAVDGLIVAGSVVLLAGYWLGWLGLVCAVAATLFANVESGITYGPLAATVAAWPAVAFTVASLILERWLKRQVSQGGHGGSRVAHGDDVKLPPDIPPGPCPHAVAGTVEEVVIGAYLHGRDCLGEAPSQRSLAATFNMSRPKVAALVGPLNGHGGTAA